MSSGRTALRIGTWNTQWAKPETPRGRQVGDALAAPGCDILCVTEGYRGILPAGGHVIDAGTDWGYATVEGRRKVLLWSRWPWSDVDSVGSDALPSGRFVAAATDTVLGSLSVVGVCIPWRDAHVRSGRKDRVAWQDHEGWLAGFEALPYRRAGERTVVLGDFNQRVPRWRQPKRVYTALENAFAGFAFATAGELAGTPQPAIDHIAHTPDLTLADDIGIWPKLSAGTRLSDHFGVRGDFAVSSTALRPGTHDPG